MNESSINYYLKFGENLQRLLDDSGTDILTVASLGNIEQKQVYRVLKGEHGASLKTIVALAKGLGVHPKELFDFEFDLEQ